MYYYTLIQLWGKYSFYRIKTNGKENKEYKHNILMLMVSLRDLFRNYKSLQKEEDILKAFEMIKQFDELGKPLNYKALMFCKEKLVDAHFKLGLSNIELEKTDGSQAVKGK